MEIRIYRSWHWVPDSNGRLGGKPQYNLIHQDQLQYREQSHMLWKPVPIVEGGKPKHPDEIKRDQDIKELDTTINNLIQNGVIVFPDSSKKT